MDKIAYICDKKRECARFAHCGADCSHTVHTLNAKYGICKTVDELQSDRFIKVGEIDEVKYYVEVEKNADAD